MKHLKDETNQTNNLEPKRLTEQTSILYLIVFISGHGTAIVMFLLFPILNKLFPNWICLIFPVWNFKTGHCIFIVPHVT